MSLKKLGFNFKERAYLIGTPILGASLPIPGVYAGLNIDSELLGKSEGELISLGTSAVISLPLVFYGAYNGFSKGIKSAISSREKRRRKEEIKESISQLEENLENTSSKKFKEALFQYRNYRKNMIEKGDNINKYDDKISEITRNFKYLSIKNE